MKKLKAGDYCHEQHELILKLDSYLRELAKEVLLDGNQEEGRITFLATVCQGALRDVDNYNQDYRAWLKHKRSVA